MKRKSIRKKITKLLLYSVTAVLLVTSTLALMNLLAMKIVFDERSRELGNKAAGDAELAMENIASEHLLNTSIDKATLIEEKMDTILASVNGIVQTAERIYNVPELYPERYIELPLQNNKELTVQLLWSQKLAPENSEGLSLPSPNADEQRELNKLANIQDLLLQYNANNDMISSTYIATETGWMIQADYIAYSKYSAENTIPDYYEASERQWYIKAKESEPGSTVYSDVITDIHEGKDCIVCAKAVYHNEEVVAVVGIGSYLDVIYREVLDTTIGNSGYSFLVNDKGKIVVSGAEEGETAVSSEQNADLRNSSNEQLAKATESMVAGECALVLMNVDGREVYLAYAPLDNLGWSFVTVMDRDEVITPAIKSQNMILELTEQVGNQVDISIRHTLISFIIVAFFLFLLIGILAVRLGRHISNPIRQLTEEVSVMDGSNLEGAIILNTGDEVEELAGAFNKMRLQIKSYIINLEKITAEKERIHTELSVATNIQNDMLPDSDSMLCSNDAFSLYAVAYPAKEVGGDFYDFFMIDNDHLVFLVADVSGKSVPAALFMVMAKTLIENQLMLGKSPAETFESVNSTLCMNNRNGMFLTAWLGVLELSSGNLEYVNAGHNAPLWYRSETKEYTWLTEVSGFVLAGMEDMTYKQKKMKLDISDKIFIYSDGVPETNDEKERMFGNAALEEFLKHRTDLQPDELCKQLKKTLNYFQGNAEQFDDITMMMIEYHGSRANNMWSGVPNEFHQSQIAEELRKYLQYNRIEKKQLHNLMVVFDEVYSNIRYYSQAKNAMVKCTVTDQFVKVLFEDDGVEFDPTQYDRLQKSLDIQDRKIGGLGIFIVYALMDEVEYQRTRRLNVLTIQMNLKTQSTV